MKPIAEMMTETARRSGFTSRVDVILVKKLVACASGANGGHVNSKWDAGWNPDNGRWEIKM